MFLGRFIDSEFDIWHGKIDYTVSFWDDYQIVSCPGFDTISYRSYRYFSEYGNGNDDGKWEERYPNSEVKVK